MASQYARTEVVNVGPDSSAVGYTMYHVRGVGTNQVTGAHYDFGQRAAERLACGSVLPEAVRRAVENAGADGGVPAWIRAVWEAENESGLDEAKRAEKVAHAAAWMWSEAERMELVKDGSRFRHRGQLARTQVLALPKEFTLEEQRELVLVWIEEQFTRHGLVVTWSIHEPDATSPENYHAHLTISTRVLLASGFDRTKDAAKAIGPKFYDGSLVARNVYEKEWRRLQEEFAAERGIEIGFSDQGVSRLRIPRALMPGEQRPGRKQIEPRGGAEIVEENARREAVNERLKVEPGAIVERLTARKDLFTVREVERTLRKEGVEGEEFDSLLEAVLGEAVLLADRRGDMTGMYTSRRALKEAREAVALAEKIEGRQGRGHGLSERTIKRAVEEFNREHSYRLDEEQTAAVRRVSERRMSVWRGIAGGGKSSALEAVVEAHRKAGFRTVGTAFTNAVARNLGKRGMDEADTLHAVLYGLERGTKTLDARTLVIVDEAGQVSNELWTKLLAAVEQSGAKLLVVGDDRQLPALERGGLLQVMVERFGAAEFTHVHRQDEDWMKQATEALAAGRFAEGVKAYRQHGAITFGSRIEDARTALVRSWMADARKRPNAVRFVYAQVNAEVDRLNEAIREERKREGAIVGQEWTFTTERRGVETTTKVSAGDRVQLYGNRKKEGLLNGYCGTVLEAWPDQMRVRLDSGRIVTWDPAEYREWGLGYAGTVYRGQGKTQAECYYLHTPLTESANSYVAWSRHTSQLRIFVARETTPDEETLALQMGRRVERGSCLRYREATPGLLALDEGFDEMVRQGATRRKVEDLRPVVAAWLDTTPEAAGIGDWETLLERMRKEPAIAEALDRIMPRQKAEIADPEFERMLREYEEQDRLATRVTTWFREAGEKYDEATQEHMIEIWSEVIGAFGEQPVEFMTRHVETTATGIIKDLCSRSEEAQSAIERLPLAERLEVDVVLERQHQQLVTELSEQLLLHGGKTERQLTAEERIGLRQQMIETARRVGETAGGLAFVSQADAKLAEVAERLIERGEVLNKTSDWLRGHWKSVADKDRREGYQWLDHRLFFWVYQLEPETFEQVKNDAPNMLLQAASERDTQIGKLLDELPPLAPFDRFVAETKRAYRGWIEQMAKLGIEEPMRSEARENCLKRVGAQVKELEEKAAREKGERGRLGRMVFGASKETREELEYCTKVFRGVVNDFGLGRGVIDEELETLREQRRNRQKVQELSERIVGACVKVERLKRSERIEEGAGILEGAIENGRVRGSMIDRRLKFLRDLDGRLAILKQHEALASARDAIFAPVQSAGIEPTPDPGISINGELDEESKKTKDRKGSDQSLDLSM